MTLISNLINKKSRLLNAINYTRGKGNTTSLVNIIKNDKRAVLVVSSEVFKDRLIKVYELNDIKSQIVSFEQLDKMLGYKDIYYIFDNHVINLLFSETKWALSDVEHKLIDIRVNLNKLIDDLV